MTPNCRIYSKHLTYILTVLRPSLPWSYGSWIYNYLCNQCPSPLKSWVRISIRARCTVFCDKVYQWLATDRWFSPGPPVSSTNKTDRHDITELLLKVALNTNKQTNKTNNFVDFTLVSNTTAIRMSDLDSTIHQS